MKSLKIASMAAIALIAAGCASQPKVDENSEIAALRAANNTSKQPPNVFRKKHRKVLFSCPRFAA